ncbi:MAG TPA: PilZ domain-containing protein [Thermoanaerobaculia bacterium]|nr:PilZ domain-containing protein [Thermoanaerobaculia bacterium]
MEGRRARKLAEQRVSPRVSVGAPASLRWGEEELSGFVESINLAGMYVAASKVPELGEYVDLVFSLPRGGKSFRVRASVVHTLPRDRRSGFGARFERPPLGFLEAIRGLRPNP